MPIGKDGSGASMMSDYLDALLLELAHYGDKLGKVPISSIFFGGGTPSLLPPDIVGNIIEKIDRTFQITPRAEISLEANPESLSRANKAGDFLAAGVNRLSIGIQSLDDTTLRMLGRPHKAQDSLNAVLAARTAGFTNISVDLMWGLPGQGVRQWLQTLKDVVRLAPDHISSYGLTLEPGTQLELDCDAGRLVMPPERDQNIMFMEGAAFLETSGYMHYEISNFARMGFQCRHNLGYWEGEDYLGLGPSATSTIAGSRWTNPASLSSWNKLAHERNLGKQAEILSPRTRVLEQIMLRLRTSRGLRLKAYKQLTGKDFLKEYQKLVQAMHENGLIRIRNGYLSLTRSGMLVSNAIISNIFERIDQNLGGSAPKAAHMPEIPNMPMIAAGEARAGNDEIRKVVFPEKTK